MPNENNITELSLEDLRIFAQQQKEKIEELTQANDTLTKSETSLKGQIDQSNKDYLEQSQALKNSKAKIAELKASVKDLTKKVNPNAPESAEEEVQETSVYHEFELGPKKYKWNILGRARFMAMDTWSSPDAIMAMENTEKRDELLAELVDKHPTLFAEQFSAE